MIQETIFTQEQESILKLLGLLGTIIYWIWLIKYVRKGGNYFKTRYYKRNRYSESEYSQYEKHDPKHPNRGKK